MTDSEATLVPPAEIARLAGVTRAAVSNWRRRHPDFPQPTGGTAAAPLFALHEVQQWLDQQGKGRPVTEEVRLWQALRSERPEDMVGALVAVAAELAGESIERPLTPATVDLLRDAIRGRTADQLLTDLLERFTASPGHGEGEHVSTPTLVRVVRHFAGETTGTVYDPACGIGDLLLATGGPQAAERIGQDLNPDLTELVRLRAAQAASPTPIKVASGDALRADRFPSLKADLVVCDPPTGQGDWGRDELLLDPRWEIGLPPKAEGDLAWLQHCYFHTAPGGRTLLVLPASAAYRRSGRRLRANLLRGGILHALVALPGGLVTGHSAPVHLWILRRPVGAVDPEPRVWMFDLTDADLSSTPLVVPEDRMARVSVISLLDDEVDLTPSRHVAAGQPGYAGAYETARQSFEALFGELSGVLPRLPEADRELAGSINISELIRGGLVEIRDGQPVSTTDQLDTDFLRGFLNSPANVRRNTSGSGTYRADPRGARVPQMDPERQRAYGTAFRELESFVRKLEDAAKMGRRAVRLAQDGLTSGTLEPVDNSERKGDE